MNLGAFIAAEFEVHPEHILLLRHSNSLVKKLILSGARVEEDFTFVQPINSQYDYLAEGKPLIQKVVVIVNDHVFGVYHVEGVESVGTSRDPALVSPEFIAFDEAQGYPEVPTKRYLMKEVKTDAKGRLVVGWTNPRCPVARYCNKLYRTVEIND